MANPLHLGFSVSISVILLGLTVLALVVYGKSDKERKVFWRLQIIGFLLLFLQSAILYIPIPITFQDTVITVKLLTSSLAYVVLGASFVVHVMDMKKGAKKTRKK
ncbi:MAG: hypothetical protein ACOC32_02810 [Nanoarchaeota archaeon]